MDITPLVQKGQQIIQSYAGGSFKINGQNYNYPVVVFTDQTYHWECVKPAKELDVEDFSLVTSAQSNLDVVLLGTGSKMEYVSFSLKAKLKDKGIIVEHMDTGAACRTYNVLMAEGRRVAAMLIPTAY